MTNIIEAHIRGATILKLRSLVKGDKALNPLLEEVGVLYGMSGDEITEVLSVGASMILYEADIAPCELTDLEAAEARVNNMRVAEHLAQQEG